MQYTLSDSLVDYSLYSLLRACMQIASSYSSANWVNLTMPSLFDNLTLQNFHYESGPPVFQHILTFNKPKRETNHHVKIPLFYLGLLGEAYHDRQHLEESCPVYSESRHTPNLGRGVNNLRVAPIPRAFYNHKGGF